LGIVTIKGEAAVDGSSTQQLTNKTIGAGSSYTGNTIAVGHGGTGAQSFTSGALLKGNGTNAISVATAAEILTAVGTVPVGNGGTGTTSFTAGALLKGSGANAISVATAADIVSAIGTTAVTNATKVATASFTIEEAGGKLVFKSGTTVIATLTTAGVFTTLNDITAFGASPL